MNNPQQKIRRLRPVLLGMFLIASSSAFALDPNLPPSGNFDMSIWRLTLPVDENGNLTPGGAHSVYPSELSAGYEMAPYFHTGPDGAMVFSVPYNGITHTTTGSPRSEHREFYPNDTKHNWLPRDNDGVHVMDAICAVENVGAGGVVSIGQIHTDDSTAGYAAIMLFFDNSVSPSRVTAKIKTSANKVSANHFLYFPNIPLGELFSYQLRIDGSATSCLFSVTVNGVTQTFDMYASDSGYADELFYYKAGAYYTGKVAGETAVVSFYYLDVAHGESEPALLDITTTSLPSGQLGSAYSQQLSASGGTSPYAWSKIAGDLPTGLALNSTGAITGTPSVTGTFNFTAQVTDAASATDTQALSITIVPASSQVADPVFSPAGGTYSSPQVVSLSTATAGAEIRYTTNGSEPSPTNGTLYTGPGTVSTSMTIKAIAYKTGMTNSNITTANYTIVAANAVPVIVEAESVSIDPAYWSIVADGGASGGQAVRALVSSTGAPPSGGGLIYTFSLDNAATVYFQVKGLAGNANANECWVRVNNGSWSELNFTWTGSGYKWKKVSAGLPAGTHTFEIRCNEANTQIDQVAATLSSSNPN